VQQQHQSDPRILNRRSLQKDHRHLAQLLRPGLSVLDVGFGTGAITVGIAEAVAPGGFVIGVDRDPDFLETAPS
jgi:ubiquinone/menaquinone biosynthesis C-methylase UbiE